MNTSFFMGTLSLTLPGKIDYRDFRNFKLIGNLRKFNTSGPNIPEKHYTVQRTGLINKGIELVKDERYFTIWAPRQTGKSTYFRQLANELANMDYKVAHINFENYENESLRSFINQLTCKLTEFWNIPFFGKTIVEVFQQIERNKNEKYVLIIDEVEGINREYFGDLLHSIRAAFHSREYHGLKSVILVGLSNIVGVEGDNFSPYNISESFNLPYFTNEEVFELFAQHETETGQGTETKVKQKISEITANHPDLVNGFVKRLVEENPYKNNIGYEDYLKAEDRYLTEASDKNFSNLLNMSKENRSFVERLLFTEEKIPFRIDRPSIKLLHTNGLIKDDGQGYVAFWVPFYKKWLYKAFYPCSNDEKHEINTTFLPTDFHDKHNSFNIDKLVENYKIYVKRRGFKPFLEKDEQGNYKSIKESALIYSFETFITAITHENNGKIYREADTGLGKSDIIANIGNNEFLVETKVYSGVNKFETGKKQLAYYANSLGLQKAVYLVFLSKQARIPDTVKEQTETIDNIEISTYLISYDKTKW